MPARALDVLSNFRKCFCPDVEPKAFDVLCAVLNRVYRARESAKISDIRKQHDKKITALQRKFNTSSSLVTVQQLQKIAALKREVKKLRMRTPSKDKTIRGGKRMGAPADGSWAAITTGKDAMSDVAVLMESSLKMKRRCDTLTVENVKLRDAVRKALAAIENTAEIHKEGAMAQNRHVQRCWDCLAMGCISVHCISLLRLMLR